MSCDAFERLVKVHLDNLHSTLAAEHRLAVEQLEGKIAAWEKEEASQKQRVQHEDPPGLISAWEKETGPPDRQLVQSEGLVSAWEKKTGTPDRQLVQSEGRAVSSTGEASPGFLRLSTFSGSAAAQAALGEAGQEGGAEGSRAGASLPRLLQSRLSRSSEGLRSARASVRGRPGSRASIRGPPVEGEVPIQEHADGDSRPSGCSGAGGMSFKVLDIWDKPRLRMNSRKVSCHSLERMSTSSTFFSNNTPNSGDETDVEDSTAQRWLVRRLRQLIIPPSSLQYLFWEILGLIFVAYDIITIPLQIFEPPESTLTDFLSWCVRCFWTVDVPVSFLTGYVSPQGFVELRPAKVAKRYIHTRFCFDLALVSCDWVEAMLAALEGGQSSEDAAVLRLLSMLRAIRLVRLLRLVRSQKISVFIFEHIRSEGVKLVAYITLVMMLLLCLIHVIACVWHGIHQAPGVSWQEQYFAAYHYVLSLFAGEQLQQPESLAERLFVIAVLVFALVVSAAFVGSLTTAMTQLQIIASKRSTQFAALNRYLSDYGISRELASRVQRNARHGLQEQKRHTPESSVELMRLISDPLRSEIHFEVYSPVLTAHPFFCLYNKVNHVGVRHICHTAVCPVSLSRGDVIFSELELPVSPRMFFLVSGRLVYVRGMDAQQNVGTKHWVAEAVLWTKWAHRGTLRALTDSRLLAVDALRVANIMSTFPTLHGFNYAVKFVESLNQATASTELTDISEGEEQARQMATCVFLELDSAFEVPWESRCSKRPSNLSVGSFVSSTRLSFTSRRSSAVSVVPSATTA